MTAWMPPSTAPRMEVVLGYVTRVWGGEGDGFWHSAGCEHIAEVSLDDAGWSLWREWEDDTKRVNCEISGWQPLLPSP